MSETHHPFLNPGFPVRWSQLKPEHIEPDIRLALERAGERLEAIAMLRPEGGELDYEATFGALEAATEELSEAWGLVRHLDSVCNSPELRAAQNVMLPEVSAFFALIPLNERLWAVLKAYGESGAVEALSSERRRFVEETMADFRESGADLSPEKKKELQALEERLAELTQKFSENVLDSTNAWEMWIDDEDKLAGLSETAKAAALASAKQKEGGAGGGPRWRFTLHAPSYAPLMEQLEDETIRREAWEAMSEVGRAGKFDNSELVWEILELRHRKAELLECAQFADLVLARRMAESGSRALGFIDGLYGKIAERFAGEVRELEAYRADKLDRDPESMEPWDFAFWSEKRRRENYAFDDEVLRPYFPIDGVIGGLFELAGMLFGIRIEEREVEFHDGAGRAGGKRVEVWHPEVKYYEVSDVDGVLRGGFYADWHPRESKRGGAWMNCLRTGLPPIGGDPRQLHLGLICGNMTPSAEDRPALLTHREVETIFHEFGHLIHHLLGDVPVRGLNGISVPWDFVELPSQIMENFCWERESLDLFARHWQTGEQIPEELFQKMVAARNYQSAIIFMRQLSFSRLDLAIHIDYRRYAGGDLDEVSESIQEGYTLPLRRQAPSMLRRFSHLFSSPVGYAAGYYSYKWAEVLDADAFGRFKREGVLNPEVGLAFRQAILSKGNSRNPVELYRDFMGRDPDPSAVLERAGLL